MEIKEILVYHRRYDCWVCPECDLENETTLSKCSMCQCLKPNTPVLLVKWSDPPMMCDDPPDDVLPKEILKTKKLFFGYAVHFAAVVAIVFLLASAISVYLSVNWNTTYSDAVAAYERENYTLAIQLLDSLPTDYKKTYEFLNAARYGQARKCMNNEEYVSAMNAFEKLGTYRDCSDRFDEAEKSLISYNQRNSYFTDEKTMLGRWSDGDGNYIEYITQSDGSIQENDNLPGESGEYFKVECGVHYVGSDADNWEKRWICQKTDDKNIQVYNYSDGEIYDLKLE